MSNIASAVEYSLSSMIGNAGEIATVFIPIAILKSSYPKDTLILQNMWRHIRIS